MRYTVNVEAQLNKSCMQQKKYQNYGTGDGWEFLHSQPIYWGISDKPDGRRQIYSMYIHGVKCIRETMRMNNNPKAIHSYFVPGVSKAFTSESAVLNYLKSERV